MGKKHSNQLHFASLGSKELEAWFGPVEDVPLVTYDPERRLMEYLAMAQKKRFKGQIFEREVRQEAKRFMDWLKDEVWGLPTEAEQQFEQVAEFKAMIRFFQMVKIKNGAAEVTAMNLIEDPSLTLLDLQALLGPILAQAHRYYEDKTSTEGIVFAENEIAQAFTDAHDPRTPLGKAYRSARKE